VPRNRAGFKPTRRVRLIGQGWSDVFVHYSAITGSRFTDATARRPWSNSRLCRDQRYQPHRTFKKQGESVCTFRPDGAPPFRPFLFLTVDSWASAKTAVFKSPAALGIKSRPLQNCRPAKDREECPFYNRALYNNRLHDFAGRPHNCWKSTARSSDATAVMRMARS